MGGYKLNEVFIEPCLVVILGKGQTVSCVYLLALWVDFKMFLLNFIKNVSCK